MYRIEVDDRAGIVRMTLNGFWTTATLGAFAVELAGVIERLRHRHPNFSILSDSTDFPVQSAAVSEGFGRLMQAGADRNTGRTAIVVATALNRMQAERVFTAANIRVFTNIEQAQDWLSEPRPTTMTDQ